ncbi:ATP-binding cassette domain-containing protein [Nonomuraea ferruginea]
MLRLRGHFLAMATLALGEILYLLLTNSEELGGSSGFGGIPPFSVFGLSFGDQRAQVYLVLVVLALGLWFAVRMKSSREGRALRALRINETVASAHGVDAARAKTKAFVLSAVFGSVAGSLYAHTMMYVNPAPFGVMHSVEILVVAVIGGVLSPWGPLVGAAVLTLIREASTSVIPGVLGEGAVGAGEEFTVGLLLVLVLVLMPEGVVGALGRLRARLLLTRSVADPAPAQPSAPATAPSSARSPGRVRLQVSGLTKRFGGVVAVGDVDLVLHDSEILGVIGPNGASKSTLINLLSGVLTPPPRGASSSTARTSPGRPPTRWPPRDWPAPSRRLWCSAA